MKPSRNSACAVVSNGIRDRSHRHRSFAGVNSTCPRAGLMFLEVIERGTLAYAYVRTPYFGRRVEDSVTCEPPPALHDAACARETHPSPQPRWLVQLLARVAQKRKALPARR